MAKRLPGFTERLTEFVGRQPLFFVATATDDSRINLSPKGMDSLRILGPNRLLWLNVTGSGNESAAHVLADRRMTVMWCSFAGAPLILRAYGTARVVYPHDADWAELAAQLPDLPGARQLFDLHVDLVQTSCGMAVPLMDYRADRDALRQWAARKSEDELSAYWEAKNLRSMDGLDTGLRPPD